MGLESRVTGVLAKGGVHNYRPLNTKLGYQLKFHSVRDRNTAHTILKESGLFNPYKIGKYIIRFNVVGSWR